MSRWGILNRPMSRQFSLRKVGALVLSLCKIHNSLINDSIQVPPPTAEDNYYSMLNGDLDLSNINNLNLHGGEHFDDYPSRTNHRSHKQAEQAHPRERIFRQIHELDYRRPSRRQN